MLDHQREFLDMAIERKALRFGQFTLKSGRVSPYFFNAGAFHRGQDLARLGRCYAAAAMQSGIDFDLVFGPAYKGIALGAVTAAALADRHGRDCDFTYNRKEAKDHGEGGSLVGAALSGRVLIVDDVITAGTAIRESLQLIESHAAQAVGVLIALDRQERGQGTLSAAQELTRETGLPVISIINLSDLLAYVGEQADMQGHLNALLEYRERYGI